MYKKKSMVSFFDKVYGASSIALSSEAKIQVQRYTDQVRPYQ